MPKLPLSAFYRRSESIFDRSEADEAAISPGAADRTLRNLRAIAATDESPTVLDMYERACWNQGIAPDVTAEVILGARS